MSPHATLRINSTRLNSTLQETCTSFGALSNSTGMRRLALSQPDKEVRDWLVAECKSLGCEVKIDQMGNIFAIRKGSELGKGKRPIGMGSHLDTQPAGGRYDGILGVHSALEVLRTLHENQITTHCPLALINWTNEEGARFPGSMMASGVWSHHPSAMSLSASHSIRSTDDKVTLLSALQKTGYLGTTPCDYRENGLEAYFELHIEQGPILEKERKMVGVVKGIQGMKWFEVRVNGVEGHSGTAPMEGRSDALVTASKLITAVNDMARSSKLGVATVGVINNDTQSQATIPSGVQFIIDVRCSTDAMVDDLCGQIFKRFDEIVEDEKNETGYTVVREWGLPESVFQEECVRVVREAAVEEVGEEMVIDMKSGAGHDAGWASKVVNTCMIFVPSKDGISHNPNEYTSPEDCALGAQVLLHAVLKYDEAVKNGTIT